MGTSVTFPVSVTAAIQLIRYPQRDTFANALLFSFVYKTISTSGFTSSENSSDTGLNHRWILFGRI